MPVRRRIAATSVTAFQTHTQMHPLAPDLQAILAALGARGDVFDVIEVRARSHDALLCLIGYNKA
jgi:hypothetical protein